MNDLPDVKVNDIAGVSSRNSIAIRGIGYQIHFQILIDGLRITSPSNDAMPIMENFPVHLAKQIEIVYGPASAVYGADAVTGVINIVTKKPNGKDIVSATTSVGMYGYTDNNFFFAKKFSENVRLTLSAQYSYDKMTFWEEIYKNDSLWSLNGMKTGTFNTNFGKMTPKDEISPELEQPSEAYNIYANLSIHEFSFSAFKSFAKVPNSAGYGTENAVWNKDVFFAHNITSLSAAYSKRFGNITSHTQLSTTEYELDPKSNFRNLYVNLEYGYKYSFSTMLKVEQQFSWKPTNSFTLSAGGVYESYYSIPKTADHDDPIDTDKPIRGALQGTKTSFNPEGIPDDVYILKYYNVGGYIQGQYNFSEILFLTLGSRFDYNSQYESTINPRLGLVFLPTDRSAVKLLFGTAFLAPTPFMRYEHYGSFIPVDSAKTYISYYWHLPNPDVNYPFAKDKWAS